jgi:hypothetical protein
VGWWCPAAWKEFKTQVPEWMDSQLKRWQEEGRWLLMPKNARSADSSGGRLHLRFVKVTAC